MPLSSLTICAEVTLATVALGCGPDTGSDRASLFDDTRDDAGTSTRSDVNRDGWTSRLPPLESQGGPVLTHLRLVTITFEGDPQRDAIEAFGAWMVRSAWLREVTAEYGVESAEVLADVRVATRAPSRVTQAQIESFLMSGINAGTLPRAPDGTLTGVYYAVHYPRTTTIDAAGSTSCGFHGYHSELTLGRERAAYGVMPTCDQSYRGFSELDGITTAASHELVEAATDPYVRTAPAYLATASVWRTYPNSAEVTDRCVGLYLRIDGYVVARSWSNASIRRGEAECVPAPRDGNGVNAP